MGLTKPDPRIYQKALQAFCAEPFQALMVGDKIHCDFDPPKAMGMNALLIERSNTFIANERINTLVQVLKYVDQR